MAPSLTYFFSTCLITRSSGQKVPPAGEQQIKADLNRWFEESVLDAEQLSAAAVRAIEDWLDEDTVEFEPDDG